MPEDNKKVAIFYADKSNPEFRREAERLHKFYSQSSLNPIDCSKNEDKESRRQAILAVLKEIQTLDAICFVCHGWKQGIELGFNTTSIDKLSEILKGFNNPNLKVVLYCCGTAEGDEPSGNGGFADLFRDASSFQVDAHDGKGHCTSRPYVKRFSAGNPGNGGEWLIAPTSNPLWRIWYNHIRDRDHNDFRFMYPLMTKEEIEAYLHALR